MIGRDAAVLERRRHLILAHETETARAIAVRIVEKPALSVWMILIPLVFLHYMQRHRTFKHGVEAVTQDLLRTRREALELACGAATAPNTPGGPPGSVRAAETAEIAALAEHYRRLLNAEGRDYAALVRSAYGDAGAYARVIDDLMRAERAVLSAANVECDGMRDLSPLVEALERARTDLRMHQLTAIFGEEVAAPRATDAR